MLAGVSVSNGLDWSPDGSLAYYDDTATHRVDVFDYDPCAGLTNRRPFVRLGERDLPDGLTVDADGGVWVALNGRGAVHRYTPSGVLDAVVEVPAAQVTACTFGGPRLDQLFITTSRENPAPGHDPLAGALFRADVGATGLPAREFAG
jgi:sugar lactone lactonase YvrE